MLVYHNQIFEVLVDMIRLLLVLPRRVLPMLMLPGQYRLLELKCLWLRY